MNYGKKQSSQKTREPYGKVTKVGQVPIALQEIAELSNYPNSAIENTHVLMGRLMKIRLIAESIIAVTCASPGCLLQMAEAVTLIPIEQAFTCHGCDTEIVINQDDPRRRMFEWADGTIGKKHPYCFNCDGALIQDGELPNAKKKREV